MVLAHAFYTTLYLYTYRWIYAYLVLFKKTVIPALLASLCKHSPFCGLFVKFSTIHNTCLTLLPGAPLPQLHMPVYYCRFSAACRLPLTTLFFCRSAFVVILPLYQLISCHWLFLWFLLPPVHTLSWFVLYWFLSAHYFGFVLRIIPCSSVY